MLGRLEFSVKRFILLIFLGVFHSQSLQPYLVDSATQLQNKCVASYLDISFVRTQTIFDLVLMFNNCTK